ncbi:MAG: glycerate kinase [Cytophagales bacterium]|nr:glycerate kinase [Cytophagales bacterium]
MKYLLLPDKFKNSLSASEAAHAMKTALLSFDPKAVIKSVQASDGGEGFLKVFAQNSSFECVTIRTKDPLFRSIKAPYLYQHSTQTAVVELAQASGLQLLKPSEYNCLESSTFGTGRQIAHALNKGAKRVILGIGGSASNDGGMGILTALGYSFFDSAGYLLNPTGKNLSNIANIECDRHSPIGQFSLQIACDVKNPLTGKDGAAYVYSPQKGASPEDVRKLDEGLNHFANKIKHFNGNDILTIEGAGAAGGAGGGLAGLANAELHSGFSLVSELLDIKKKSQWADWILTGEGKLDKQTLEGKWVHGVSLLAREFQTPVAGFFGSSTLNQTERTALGLNFTGILQKENISSETAHRQAYDLLVKEVNAFTQTLFKPAS